MEFWLPYGSTEVPVRIPDQNFQRIIESSEKADSAQQAPVLVERALDSPIGKLALRSAVKPGTMAGVLVDPIIPKTILDSAIELVQARLGQGGISDVRVYARNRSSIQAGDRKTINPTRASFEEIGQTSRGTKVMVDQDFLRCDIKLLIGMVQPHFASGFVGGPDLVVPGAAALETIAANRSLGVTGNPLISSGYEENPVYLDSLEAAKMLSNVYLLTFVPDDSGGIAAVNSGELEATFKESVSQFQRLHSPAIDSRPEIIVVSSDGPYSTDLYHAVRILPSLSNILKRGGSTVVLAAECHSGVGDSNFMTLSKQFEDRRGLQFELKRRFKLGGHVALQLKECLEKSRVQLVSVVPDAYCRSFGLKPSRTVSAGVQSAIRVEGKDARILIIPRGSLTVPVMATSAVS